MKNIRILIILLLVSIQINAQVGIGTTTPNPNAALDVVSANKGFLPPRVANVASITTPVAGLLIYDESNQCMRYYNGTIWSDCMGSITAASPCGTATTMTDIDGNTYAIVQIGNQCWMASDLKVSRYPNGDAIPYIDNDVTWAALANNNTDDAYGFYGDSNNDGIVDITYPDYGALYTYAAAIGDNWARDNSTTNNSEGGQGICPDGWHLPTKAEWTTLTAFLGGATVAGGEMKETGTTHWYSPNIGATNSSGFTAFGTGYRTNLGGYGNLLNSGIWWSGTLFGSQEAYRLSLTRTTIYAIISNYYKSNGYCVRCIKD